jgi:nicotinamidase-related amidase
MSTPSFSRQTADGSLEQQEPHRSAVIGNAKNFWLHSTKTGFDLTHPEKPSSPLIQPRLTLNTITTPITISPSRSALIIIDMQNFFLSEALGRSRGAGHTASDNLIKYAIPAARAAGIRIVWLNWGLSEEDVENMPPAVKRAFGFEAVVDEKGNIHALDDGSKEKAKHVAVDKHGELRENGKDVKIYKGLGSECGEVTLPDGTTIDAGRLLMRDSWNAALYPPLDKRWQEGRKLEKTPDVWIHKNRMSGMWSGTTPCEKFLEEEGIKTLLFTGVNTDQCVSGTFTDAFSKGYDCIMLNDGCGTTSPSFAQDCIEFNAARTWGFVASCEDFSKGVDEMMGGKAA